VRKGEIWDVAPESGDRHPYRVVIVTDDAWQDGGARPQCVALVRAHGAGEILPLIVSTHAEADSVAGLLILDSLAPIDPRLFVEPVGSVGVSTLSKLDHCLRKVYGL
jgi:hypothetical protein